MAGDQRVERRPLTRRRIVEAALAIVDERGLPDLTMRRLGARLGVEAMSIYKHLPSKEAVIEGVRELLLDELAQLRAEHPPDEDWFAALGGVARAFREVCRRHPRALPLFAADADRAYAASSPSYEPVLRRLVEAGFDREEAVMAVRIVVRHVLADGMLDVTTVTRTTPMTKEEVDEFAKERPLVAELVRAFHRGPGEDLFEVGLQALLDGLRLRLEARRRERDAEGAATD